MMRIEFLGTAAALSLPRPTCDCRLCAEARGRGVPYSRNLPSLFVHGPDLLIDTPEDVVHSLNRAGVRHVGAVTWSHWHPDHSAGVRVFEALGLDLRWPPDFPTTPVFVPEGVAEDFRHFLGLDEQLTFHEARGLITRQTIPDGGTFNLGGVTIQPLRLPSADAQCYAFILTEGEKRVLLMADELFGWEPTPDLGHFDLVVLPSGLFAVHPLTGERLIVAEHPILEREATFAQALDIVQRLDADRVVFVHLPVHEAGLSYDELMQVQREVFASHPGLNMMFAFDRLSVSV